MNMPVDAGEACASGCKGTLETTREADQIALFRGNSRLYASLDACYLQY